MVKVKEKYCEINRSFDFLLPEFFMGSVHIAHNIRNKFEQRHHDVLINVI